ncbi:Protein CBG02521 [Caenorhabditis briggsae]|uniref:Protein CBG02521 n=1 Tax=Caenorhabditis briggsae TaxID=6238 RepID=A8WU45_CAEBR|nr:Protein CBG02521 [Caenorhabditis briggsae]CAP24007.2 Protein CBG02521 [Caenorhabditis briggsae]
MRSKIRYQLLDQAGAPRNFRLLWLFLFAVACFVAYFLLSSPSTNGVFNPLKPDARNPITYEQVMKDLRNEIDQRNVIINELQQDLEKMELKNDFKNLYRRRPETDHVDCGRILSGDKVYLESVSGKNRIKIVENDQLDMSCAAIMNRILPPGSNLKPLKNGVAFARIVYADYEMIEKQIQMSYHPQNSFCFAIDKKAPPQFHERLRVMAACLPNVLLLPDEESVDSAGHNINSAHYNCMRVLINKPGWNYVILLQNHDLITKSVYELEQVYEWLGGANDVEITPEAGRLDNKFKWDPKSLKMFRNATGIDEVILNGKMKFAKGAAQGSLSRAAVDWMVRTADLTTYIDQWNKGGFGVDEQFIQSFQVSSDLGMPGHFTDECLKQGKKADFVSRFVMPYELKTSYETSRMSQWKYGDSDKCGSKTVRHAICLLGIEDFRTLAAYPNLMFNKMIPSFDYAIVECSAELLHNRTFLGQEDHKLEEDYYKNMINVLYHKNHLDPNFKLECTPSYTKWAARDYPL